MPALIGAFPVSGISRCRSTGQRARHAPVVEQCSASSPHSSEMATALLESMVFATDPFVPIVDELGKFKLVVNIKFVLLLGLYSNSNYWGVRELSA